MEEPLAGGFNTCTARARGGVNVIERVPHTGGATIEIARREAQITKLMSMLEIGPLLLAASIDEHGRLRATFVKHGLDLSRTLRIGGLSTEQPIEITRTRELTAQLMRVVCFCADAGFFHGDLKPANIVLWLRRTGLSARFIDWDPQFLSSVEADAGLLTAMRAQLLRARLPEIACDALRCLYATAMWGCLVLFLETEAVPREGELLTGRLQSATRHALTECAINPVLLQMLTRPEPPSCELVSVLGHYASQYLQLYGIAEFFHELRTRPRDLRSRLPRTRLQQDLLQRRLRRSTGRQTLNLGRLGLHRRRRRRRGTHNGSVARGRRLAVKATLAHRQRGSQGNAQHKRLGRVGEEQPRCVSRSAKGEGPRAEARQGVQPKLSAKERRGSETSLHGGP